MITQLHSEGNWALKRFDAPQGHTYYYHFLDHDCAEVSPVEPQHMGDSPRFWWKEFKVGCTVCGSKPPEGLQALYVLMTDDCDDGSWWMDGGGGGYRV